MAVFKEDPRPPQLRGDSAAKRARIQLKRFQAAGEMDPGLGIPPGEIRPCWHRTGVTRPAMEVKTCRPGRCLSP